MGRGAYRNRGRMRWPSALRWAAVALTAGSAAFAPTLKAEQAWKTWSAGALSLEAPANWRSMEASGPTALSFGGDAWYFTLAENPHDVEAGALLNLAWTDDGAVYSAGVEPSQIVGAREVDFAGLPADRVEFAVRDQFNDTAGFDIVPKSSAAGRSLTLTCRAPQAKWPAVKPICERIVASVTLALPATVASGQPPTQTEPTAASAPATPIVEAPPLATPVRRIQVQNTDAVVGGPKVETSFTVKAPIFVRTLRTYHWNDGRGAAPGTMSLTDSSGTRDGSWQARGEPGQGGVPNAYWVTEVNQRLEPGRYTLTTSSNQTWSTNEGVGWKGFYAIEYQIYPEVAQPTPQPTATATVAATPTPTQPPPPPPPPVKTVWTPPPAHEALFSGALDARWEKLEAAGGDFANFAKQEQGALVVVAPAGHSWGHTGLYTAPANWLFFDNFVGEARQTLTFRFDPARTHGFVAAVVSDRDFCTKGGQPPGVAVVFAPKADASGSTARLVDVASAGETRSSVDVTAAGVAELVIVVTPGKASASVDGAKLAEGKIKGMENVGGYAVCLYSQGRDVNLPGSFALREITVDRVEGAADREPQPAPGVQPFPVVTLLGPKATIEWEATGVNGGDFAKFGRIVNDGFIVSTPKGDGWRNTGALSKTPLLAFDSFTEEAPYRLKFKFDPRASTDVVVQMMAPRTWDWHYQQVWFGVNHRGGQSLFFLKYCPGADILRPMPSPWNGDIEVVLHAGWYSAGIPGAFHMRCEAGSLGLGTQLFGGFLTAPDKEGSPAAFSLLSLTLQRAPPDGMTSAQRWRYVDDKAFDPKAFLGELDHDLSASGDGKAEAPNAK